MVAVEKGCKASTGPLKMIKDARMHGPMTANAVLVAGGPTACLVEGPDTARHGIIKLLDVFRGDLPESLL